MARIPKLEPAFEPADALIGIATNLPLIQLVHFINRETLLNLGREADLPVFNEKSEELQYFRFFYYSDEDYRSEFCLIANSSDGLLLLPTHRQFSFFLIVQGAIPDGKVNSLVSSIKSIPGVQLAALIPQTPIKGLGPILQDLELHLTDLKREKQEYPNRIMPLAEDQ
jgi:hypothetical protein